MFVDKLKLTNFACFPSLEMDFSPLTVLVGPNDSGKTTLLKALAAFRWWNTGFGTAGTGLTARLGVVNPTWHPGDAVIEVHKEGAAYTIRQNTSITHFTFTASPSRSPTWIEDAQRIRLYNLQPSRLRAPSPAYQHSDFPLLEEDGYLLPTVLSTLAGSSWQSLGAIQKEFSRAVTTLSGFSVLPQSVDSAAGHRLVFQTTYGDQRLEASQVSDGAILFLGYLTLLHHPESPPLLLIEEPEAGVHPGRLKGILKLLRRLTAPGEGREGVQIVLTTHSPYLLDEVRPEEAWFCHRLKDGAATATRFDRVPKIQERLREYMLGELWTAYGEERLYHLAQSAK